MHPGSAAILACRESVSVLLKPWPKAKPSTKPWPRHAGKLRPGRLPVNQRQLTTTDRSVAMDALACGYGRKDDIHHGRVGPGLTLTLDMAVGRAVGQIAGAKGAAKKKNGLWQCCGNVLYTIGIIGNQPTRLSPPVWAQLCSAAQATPAAQHRAMLSAPHAPWPGSWLWPVLPSAAAALPWAKMSHLPASAGLT